MGTGAGSFMPIREGHAAHPRSIQLCTCSWSGWTLLGLRPDSAEQRGPMPRFAANIAYLFSERPLIERPAAAAAGGFTAVEGQFPYTTPAAALRAEIERHDLTM